MGMYDYIGHTQVKCFYKYFFYHGLVTSGGSLEVYNIGDKVPYKTDWYNYTKNFNMIMEDYDEENDYKEFYLLAGIRDGKLKFVKPINKTSMIDWIGIGRCIDDSGTWRNIHSKRDAIDYVEKLIIFNKTKLDYLKNNEPVWEKFSELITGISVVSEEERKQREKELERLSNDLEEEQKRTEAFLQQAYRPLLKYTMQKPDGVEEREIIGAYKSCIETLESMQNKDSEHKKALEECKKSFEEFLEKLRKEEKNELLF